MILDESGFSSGVELGNETNVSQDPYEKADNWNDHIEANRHYDTIGQRETWLNQVESGQMSLLEYIQKCEKNEIFPF